MEDAPVSTVVLVDVSRSMRFDFPRVVAALRHFLESRSAGDDFCMLPFAERVPGECQFTANPDEALARIAALRPDGDTGLLDALRVAFLTAKRAPNPRRAVLVLTDSVDNASRTTWTQARSLAQEFDGTVYAISPPLYDADSVGDEKRLQDIAETTGGRMFRLRGMSDLGPTLDSLDLRHQYVLGYGVPEKLRDGRYHKVSVKLRSAGPLRSTGGAGISRPGRVINDEMDIRRSLWRAAGDRLFAVNTGEGGSGGAGAGSKAHSGARREDRSVEIDGDHRGVPSVAGSRCTRQSCRLSEEYQVDVGDRVRAGQTLGVLEVPEYTRNCCRPRPPETHRARRRARRKRGKPRRVESRDRASSRMTG